MGDHQEGARDRHHEPARAQGASVYLRALLNITSCMTTCILIQECGGLDLGCVVNCMVGEKLGYGCTGILTAIEANG